jgi:hypothetical protein
MQLSLSSTGAQSLKVIKLNTVRGACKFWVGTRLLVPNVQAHGDTTFNLATVLRIEHDGSLIILRDLVDKKERLRAVNGTIEQDVIRVLSMTRQQRGHLYTEKDVMTMQTDADPIRTVTNASAKVKYDVYGCTMLLVAMNALLFDWEYPLNLPVEIDSVTDAIAFCRSKVWPAASGGVHTEPVVMRIGRKMVSPKFLVTVLAHEAAHAVVSARYTRKPMSPKEEHEAKVTGGHTQEFFSFRANFAKYGLLLTQYAVFSLSKKGTDVVDFSGGDKYYFGIIATSPTIDMLYLFPDNDYGRGNWLAWRRTYAGHVTLTLGTLRSTNLPKLIGKPKSAIEKEFAEVIIKNAMESEEIKGTKISMGSAYSSDGDAPSGGDIFRGGDDDDDAEAEVSEIESQQE